ncbi:phage antirepressor KilAC domain-containing protein [Ruminococcus bicirculans (ex Wegman et al. 2014)]|uniref:phage antirepressor KilAC domain-containing protein n=1 Tax=Ruminococcus bicirculans (ex Wegman et al. 2014) TaxID=1160721 RepID=UPI003A8E9AD4
MPYQAFIDCGYFAVKESVFETPTMTKTYQQTFVTGRGQQFVINLLKKYYGKEVLQ